MATKTTTRRGAARRESSPLTGSLRTTCCAPITENALKEKDATKLAAVFAALSDPVRLRLLSIVAAEGEVCSCNLEGPLGKSQPTISHHTKVLAETGLIVGEKRGRWMWWRTEPAALEALRQALGGS
jgi:ArsR family transcriptional regulator, arsenate/arsenite/antimonite-responsive transcriptional repressor